MEQRVLTSDLLIDSSFLFEQSSDAIFILSESHIVDLNNSAIKLFGIKSSTHFDHSKVLKKIEDKKGKEYSFEVFLKTLFKRTNKKHVFRFSIKDSFFWVEISNTVYTKENRTLLFSIWRDITKTKIAEENLEESVKKLDNALGIANCATWKYDDDLDCFVISKGMAEILGIDERYINNTQLFIPLSDYKKLIHPEDYQNFKNIRKRSSLADSEDFIDHGEYRIIRPDGQVVYLYNITKVAFKDNGKDISFYGTIQDVTEMHKMEGELNKSREQLADACVIANLSTWEYEFKTKTIKVGENFLSMLGGGLNVIDGNMVNVDDYVNLIYPDDLQTFCIAIDKAMKSKKSDYIDFVEYRIERPDGALRNIFVSIKVVKDAQGNHVKHYGTVQDITAIRNAVAEKERFATIMETTTDIVVILDKDKKLIYLNRAARNFYGFSPEDDIVGFPVKILQSDHSLKLTQEEAFPIAAEKGIWSGENVIQRYDKEMITVSQVIISHKTPGGEVEYFSSIVRDISSQKQVEQDLKYKNNELDTFVYKASHDLRGPVASLLGLYNIVMAEVEDKVSLKYFELYNKQIIRLNDIILTLIQLTRIKETDVNKQIIDFEDIIQSCIDSFVNLPNFKNVNFQININLEKNFKSDRGLITTILQNLIENAIKYSKPQEAGIVDIEIKRNLNEDVLIKVEDNGVGIPKEVQTNVFNMFFRANDNTIGSGLGLYILKNAVDKLKGKVTMFSEVNSGTTFVIKIPSESFIKEE